MIQMINLMEYDLCDIKYLYKNEDQFEQCSEENTFCLKHFGYKKIHNLLRHFQDFLFSFFFCLTKMLKKM